MRGYLGEIYRLERTPEGVSTSEVAQRLEVSPPAVVRMLRRLDEAGLIVHQPYQPVKLTRRGELEALSSIRRHRLIEAFLVKVMGFGWDEVHEHAHSLEKVINDEFEDRMDAVAGHPTRCPHGDPIPTREGVMPEVDDHPISEVSAGAHGVVSRVKTHDPEKLRYIARLGLIPGAEVHVLSRAPFNGPVRLAMNLGRRSPQEQVIGGELAEVIRMEVAP